MFVESLIRFAVVSRCRLDGRRIMAGREDVPNRDHSFKRVQLGLEIQEEPANNADEKVSPSACSDRVPEGTDQISGQRFDRRAPTRAPAPSSRSLDCA